MNILFVFILFFFFFFCSKIRMKGFWRPHRIAEYIESLYYIYLELCDVHSKGFRHAYLVIYSRLDRDFSVHEVIKNNTFDRMPLVNRLLHEQTVFDGYNG